MNKIIVFSNGNELIVTTAENEEATIAEFFEDGHIRDPMEYDREEFDSVVRVELGSFVTS